MTRQQDQLNVAPLPTGAAGGGMRKLTDPTGAQMVEEPQLLHPGQRHQADRRDNARLIRAAVGLQW